MKTQPLKFWYYSYKDCAHSFRLIEKLKEMNLKSRQKVDLFLIKKAIFCAKHYHADQFRKSGEPYYTHPIEVAYMLADYMFDTDAIITAILHDTLEDTTLTQDELTELFSEAIATYVEGLTRIKPNGKISSGDMLKQLWAEGRFNLILIKLFDRLHNMQTLGAKSPEKQRKTVNETLTYFLALSEMLNCPRLSEALYQHCYETNKKLGVIEDPECFSGVDSKLEFSFLPAVENN